jgi:hypothetical protein
MNAVRMRRISAPLGLVLAIAVSIGVLLALLPYVASAATYDTEELAFLQLINQYRQGQGLSKLVLSDAISDATDKHSSDMGKYGFFDHGSLRSDFFPVGATPWDRMRLSGYDYYTNLGENIAAGQSTAQAVFNAWKASPTHDANMVNPSYRVIGIGLVTGGPYSYYWTTDFGGYVDETAHPAGSPPPSSTTTTAPTPQPTSRFSDVPDSHPYYAQIGDLAQRAIVSGFPTGVFQPESPVTRQQFAKMIVKSLGWSMAASYEQPFADVGYGMDPNDPLYPDQYVAALAASGITEGTGSGQRLFEPYANITRAQVITMIARAAGLADPPAGYAPPFDVFDPTHYEFARMAAYAGLLEGIAGMGPDYSFLQPAGRGEVSAMLYNLLNR